MASAAAIHETVGSRMTALRISRKISRSDLAAAMGVTMNLLGKIEKGVTVLTAADLVKAAKALGVTSAVLTGEESLVAFEKRAGKR